MKTKDEILEKAFLEMHAACTRVEKAMPGSYFAVLTTFIAIRLDASVASDKTVAKHLMTIKFLVEAMRDKNGSPLDRLVERMLEDMEP